MVEKLRLRSIDYSYVRPENGIEGVAVCHGVQVLTCLDGAGAPDGVLRKCRQFRWVFMAFG